MSKQYSSVHLSAAACQHPFPRTPLPSSFVRTNSSVVVSSLCASSHQLSPLHLLRRLLYLLQIISKAKNKRLAGDERRILCAYCNYFFAFMLLGVVRGRLSLLFGQLHRDQLLRVLLVPARLLVSRSHRICRLFFSLFPLPRSFLS